jgi:hypothetical protein
VELLLQWNLELVVVHIMGEHQLNVTMSTSTDNLSPAPIANGPGERLKKMNASFGWAKYGF